MIPDFTLKRCVPCEGGEDPLDEDKVKEYMKVLGEGWRVDEGYKKIKKEFKFKNFKEAMEFVNKVADLAEDEGHHPNIKIYYNRVILELTTHAIGGLSENDFIIATKAGNL